MRKFNLVMDNVYVGPVTVRDIKDSNKNKIGERTIVELQYVGGFVRVDVDNALLTNLKESQQGKATISMEPAMNAEAGQSKEGRSFTYISTGFENFKLIGFEPESSSKFTTGK